MAGPQASATESQALAIEPAAIEFDGGRPVSPVFEDIYFDADGPAETLRVFLGPAAIETRARGAELFTVAELGFGTGLNFLVTAQVAKTRRLHFVSFERHPLRRDDAEQALAEWRRDYPLAALLLDAWPPALAGWHRRHFAGGRIQLSVWHGDAAPGLEDFARQQRCGVDAWFLDGFAPTRNPAMWRAELFHSMARSSGAGATVTTFTAAGQVRRDLEAAGFETRRVDQRPHKRHSTAAVFRGAGIGFAAPERVNVLGAGLAGACAARALAEKGVEAALVDPAGIAAGASRVPAAVLHGRLLAGTTAQARLRAQAFAYSSERLKVLRGTRQTGMLQVAGANANAARLHRVAGAMPKDWVRLLSAEEASRLADIPVPDVALHTPSALTVNAGECVRALLEHPRIAGDEVSEEGVTTVLATGAQRGEFGYLELTGIGGQMDLFRVPHMPTLPLVGRGSLVPGANGLWVGATYEYRPWPAGDAELANAKRLADWTKTVPDAAVASFRGIRAVTSDRLPIVGRDASQERVWFSLGHGSHGTVTAPFAAECIASQIVGEAAPADIEMLALLSPDRFRERQRRRPNPFRNGTVEAATPDRTPERS
ncbi:MAG: tRNA (5-methylaminomethyl-2-thiouridine)(34)-methyltransferase MnmD [Gammaproteobacteria bacterium]|nr:tRNA (5-methylaminomethyl-2-thiouridine)(34)-methyltransferase MnmD [Gammaproteobacteria bacterium]